MADKIPSTEPTTDRARKINSLHNQINKMVTEEDKKRLEISDEINSLSKEQRRIMDKINIERGEFTNETAAAYNGVLKGLGKTIQNLSVGVKNITVDTAKATASSISQYGKAIGQDININKENAVTMALAKTTPLFGYFAAKFMETDVFRSAASRIKEGVTKTVSGAGRSVWNMFKKKEKEPMGVPPKLAKGGYIKKGGMVQVHPAEVVAPVDKILKKIDEVKTDDLSKRLDSVLNTLSKNIIGVEKLVGEIHEDRKGMVKTIIQEWKRASAPEEQSYQERLLKAVLELKVAMIGTSSRLRIAWQRTLLQHPVFRNAMMFGELIQSSISVPFRALFGLRGGFANDVRRATRTSNIYQQQVNLLSILYSQGMTYLRNISKFTQVAAEALVGEPVSPVSSKTYTLFGKVKEFMTSRSTKSLKDSAFETFIETLDLDRGALEDAGIKSFGDLLNPFAIIRNAGITFENIKGRLKEYPKGEKVYEKAKEAKEKYGPKAQNIYESAKEKVAKAKEKVDEVKEKYTPKVQNMYEATAGKVTEAKEKAEETVSKVQDLRETAKEKYTPKVQNMYEATAGKVTEAKEKGKEKIIETTPKVQNFYETAKKKIREKIAEVREMIIPKVQSMHVTTTGNVIEANERAKEKIVNTPEKITEIKEATIPKIKTVYEATTGKLGEVKEEVSKTKEKYEPKAQNIFEAAKGKVSEAQAKGDELLLAAEWFIRENKKKLEKKGFKERVKEKVEKTKNWTRDRFTDTRTWEERTVSELYRIRKAEEDREEREGPHSPSMAENIATSTKKLNKMTGFMKSIWKNVRYMWLNTKRTALAAKRRFKEEYKTEYEKQKRLAEIAKATKKTAEEIDEEGKKADKSRKEVKGWIPLIFGWITSLGKRLFGMTGKLGKLVSWLMGPFFRLGKWGFRELGRLSKWILGPFKKVFGKTFGKVGKGLKNIITKGPGKTLVGAAGKVGKVFGGLRGAFAGGGLKAAGKFATKGIAKMGLKGAAVLGGGALAGIIGASESLWDMAVAMVTNPEGFVGNFLVRGLSAFLGGRETGLEGAKSGAWKGGSIGVTLGTAGGPIGMAIGGAVGAAIGGILGFVGGAKISQAISKTVQGIKDAASTIWEIVKFPFQVIREISKMLWTTFKFLKTKIFNAVDELISSIPIVNKIWDWTKSVTSKITGAIGGFFSKIGSWISKSFSGGAMTEKIKQGIVDFLFPIPNLLLGLKEIGIMIDEWLSGIPIIGRFYNMAKEAIKSIRSGDLSESFRRAVEGIPDTLTEAQKEKMTAKEIADFYAKEEADKRRAQEEALRKHSESLKEQMNKDTNSINQVTIASTNIIASSNSTPQQSFGGLYGGDALMYQTGSQQTAQKVAMGSMY